MAASFFRLAQCGCSVISPRHPQQKQQRRHISFPLPRAPSPEGPYLIPTPVGPVFAVPVDCFHDSFEPARRDLLQRPSQQPIRCRAAPSTCSTEKKQMALMGQSNHSKSENYDSLYPPRHHLKTSTSTSSVDHFDSTIPPMMTTTGVALRGEIDPQGDQVDESEDPKKSEVGEERHRISSADNNRDKGESLQDGSWKKMNFEHSEVWSVENQLKRMAGLLSPHPSNEKIDSYQKNIENNIQTETSESNRPSGASSSESFNLMTENLTSFDCISTTTTGINTFYQ